MKPIKIFMGLLTLLIVLFICVFNFGGNDNTKILKSIVELKIYDVDPYQKEQDLNQYHNGIIDHNKLVRIFENIKFNQGSILWKGKFLAIGKLKDGKSIKLAVSTYGGYIKILDEAGYYQLTAESRQVFEKEFKRIIEEEFITKRNIQNE